MKTYIKYELKKVFSDSRFLFLFFICFFLNGILLFRSCTAEKPYINEEIERNYDLIKSQAYENACKGKDAGYMLDIYNRFSDRKSFTKALDNSYSDWELSGILLTFLMIFSAVELVICESKSNMTSVVCSVGDRWKKVYKTKIITIILLTIFVAFLFLAEEYIITLFTGKINPDTRLYLVKGYFETWFNGTLLQYRFMITAFNCIFTIILSLIAFVCAELTSNETAAALIPVGVWLMLSIAYDNLSKKLSFLNILSICKPGEALKKSDVVFCGTDKYMYYHELAGIIEISAFLVVISFTILCLKYRNRG